MQGTSAPPWAEQGSATSISRTLSKCRPQPLRCLSLHRVKQSWVKGCPPAWAGALIVRLIQRERLRHQRGTVAVVLCVGTTFSTVVVASMCAESGTDDPCAATKCCPLPTTHPRTMVQARIFGGCAFVSAPTHHKSARLQGTRRLRWRCACRCCQLVQQGSCHCSTISCTLEARPQASKPPAEAHHMDRQPHCTSLVLTQCIAQRSAHIAVHEGGKACRTTVGTGSIISASSSKNAMPCSCCQLTRICVAYGARCRCDTRQHQAVKLLQQHLLG